MMKLKVKPVIWILIIAALIGACGGTTTEQDPTQEPTAIQGVLRQWGANASASSEFGVDAWSAMQAAGAPDTPKCGDYGTSWASASYDTLETIELYYDIPVYATEVNVHQTYNPGYVSRVELINVGGDSVEIYNQMPGVVSLPCPYVFSTTVDGMTDFLVHGVRITLNQTALQDWSEIDAVELAGVPDSSDEAINAQPDSEFLSQWASDATASSEFGDDNWSAMQATGPPDTRECVDVGTAWASLTYDTLETLEVHYDIPVHVTGVKIYETYNPGHVSAVDLIDVGGAVNRVYSALPENIYQPPCPYITSIVMDEKTEYLAYGVRITLDQTILQDWNAIDAIELTGVPDR